MRVSVRLMLLVCGASVLLVAGCAGTKDAGGTASTAELHSLRSYVGKPVAEALRDAPPRSKAITDLSNEFGGKPDFVDTPQDRNDYTTIAICGSSKYLLRSKRLIVGVARSDLLTADDRAKARLGEYNHWLYASHCGRFGR